MPRDALVRAAHDNEKTATSHRAAAEQSSKGAHDASLQHSVACGHSTKADEASKLAHAEGGATELQVRSGDYMRQDRDLRCLDDLIVGLGGADNGTQSASPCSLLLEHLQAARRDLLGSMPGEYGLSLQQAKESVGCIADKTARAEMKKRLRSLLDSEAPEPSLSMAAGAEQSL